MTDRESQTDEICALQSIFTEEEFKSICEGDANGGQFYAFVTIPDGFAAVLPDRQEDKSKEELRIHLQYLPPIEIVFTFPPDYPSRSPPSFTIACTWLSGTLLTKLSEELDRLWEENKGLEVLFIWMQFLKEESLAFLGITNTLDLTVCRSDARKNLKKHVSTASKERCIADQKTADVDSNLSPCKVEPDLTVGMSVNVNELSSVSDHVSGFQQENVNGAFGESSGCGKEPVNFHNQTNRRYKQRRRFSNNCADSKTVDTEYPKSYQYRNNESSVGELKNTGFNARRRNYDNYENSDGVRRYERRKPRFFDGKSDKPNPGYGNTKTYRHKSPVERKISDSSFRKESSTLGKSEPKMVPDSFYKVENCTIGKEIADVRPDKDNVEGKRLFERNRRYQKYNDGDNNEMISERPVQSYKTVVYGRSRMFFNKRYQHYRGRNNSARRAGLGRGRGEGKIERLVGNLSISKDHHEVDKAATFDNEAVNVCEVDKATTFDNEAVNVCEVDKAATFDNETVNVCEVDKAKTFDNEAVNVCEVDKDVTFDNEAVNVYEVDKAATFDNEVVNVCEVDKDVTFDNEAVNVCEVDKAVAFNNKAVNVCETKLEGTDTRVKDHIGLSPRHHKHLLLFLQEYNKDRMKIEFMKNSYLCDICFQDKFGTDCMQFHPCRHVFCKECVRGYLEVRIKDGAVYNIMCPENGCTSEVTQSQVREMVSADLFARYDAVLLATTLDTMNGIVYCPRSSCQYPTFRDSDDKMARCPACNYAFCVNCKMVYHGVEPCRYKIGEKKVIYDEYQYADAEKRQLMEQKYGRKQLMSLVQTTMSEEWILDNSKNCPHCNAAIEKSDGCNKMACFKCNTFFCWLCNKRLDPLVPYKHYYNVSSPCFNLLFQGMTEDDDLDREDF